MFQNGPQHLPNVTHEGNLVLERKDLDQESLMEGGMLQFTSDVMPEPTQPLSWMSDLSCMIQEGCLEESGLIEEGKLSYETFDYYIEKLW